MPSRGHDPAASGRIRLEGLRLMDGETGAHAEPPVRVTVVGADAQQRRRLGELLAQVAGIEVAGWLRSPDDLGVLGDDLAVVVPAPAPSPHRPKLSPRQRDVLLAYAAGNELTAVVARSLGMDPETLKTHLRRIRAKYREVGRPAPTRRDLYVRAVEDGLLSPPS